MPVNTPDQSADLVIVGAGAAGLLAASLVTERRPQSRIVVLEGMSKPATKLLLTGGGRCNVTNRVVTPDDYAGSSRHAIRKVLAAFGVEQTVALFDRLGVPLHEEEGGKLFPDSNSAHTIRNALLERAQGAGVTILTRQRVSAITRTRNGFAVETPNATLSARQVLLAAGGCSYPRTGSDGSGYRLAQSLGHGIVATTPALVPLLLDGRLHQTLSGISQDVELTISAGGKPKRTRGSLLWTHFGISGPAVLDISGSLLRAKLEGLQPVLTANFTPDEDANSLDRWLLDLSSNHPKMCLRNALAGRLPAKFAGAVLSELHLDGSTTLAHLGRDDRRTLLRALLAWPLPVVDSRGYDHAEVTAGGVPLNEVEPRTMESRVCPGLFLAGEVLDVTGRVGGFNLQWAWSSAWVAAQGLARDNVASPGS